MAKHLLAPLAAAFVDDHKHLTRGLTQLKEALESGDLEEARRIANALDLAAGPHIAFEEGYFYPEIARTRGREFAERLYHEHGIGRQLLARLLEKERASDITAEERARLVNQAAMVMDHAVSCGTLLSHLTALDATRQGKLLERLLQLREHPRRWTHLKTNGENLPSVEESFPPGTEAGEEL
jgi:hypothetical protein